MIKLKDLLAEDKNDGTFIRIKSIKNNIAIGEDGSEWKIFTTKPNINKGDFALDTDVNVIHWHKDHKGDLWDMDLKPLRKVVKIK